ncbi:cohesin domain-containing protein [Ruminococcus intestinalis]|uniref:cohesin domain-containing protein n=1 Tax=Ruminococcus intestinalis TaxID=2763066 RepID=UPI003F81B14E
MNNSKHKAKRLSVALLIAVLAVSTSFASVMTGCGNKDESSSTAATVTSTASAAENTTVANDKSESELNTESSNSQSSGSESKSESAQSSEKSESSGSSDSSKANSNSNNNSSSKAANNNSNNNSGNNSGNKSNNNSSDKNNSDEKSNEDVTLDLKKGQTITVTYSVKSTVVLTNYQAQITYDSSKLKVKSALLQKPATTNGIINAKIAGKINLNGSDITTGYDYTKGGEMVVVTFEATADGSSKVNWLWQSASTIDEKNNLVYHIDNNGKSDGTVSLSTSYK